MGRDRVRTVAACGLLLLAAASALSLGGSAAFGRLALALGLAAPAAGLLDEPQWKGLALQRAGAYDAAAEAFRQAGPRASFNRAHALAYAGRFDESLAAYDAVIFRDPDDAEAHADRALIEPLASLVVGEAAAGGRIAASEGAAPRQPGAQEPAAAATRPLRHEDIVKIMQERYRSSRQTGQSVAASRQWLATLPDEPGRYLKLRLAAERERRLAVGLAVPSGGDPW